MVLRVMGCRASRRVSAHSLCCRLCCSSRARFRNATVICWFTGATATLPRTGSSRGFSASVLAVRRRRALRLAGHCRCASGTRASFRAAPALRTPSLAFDPQSCSRRATRSRAHDVDVAACHDRAACRRLHCSRRRRRRRDDRVTMFACMSIRRSTMMRRSCRCTDSNIVDVYLPYHFFCPSVGSVRPFAGFSVCFSLFFLALSWAPCACSMASCGICCPRLICILLPLVSLVARSCVLYFVLFHFALPSSLVAT